MGLRLLFQLQCSIRLQLLPERLKVKTTRQPDVRGQAPWGLRAGQCVGSTCSSWSPVFETGSLCSLEAPCNPSASVFPSAEGETSRSFWLLKNYLWVTLKIPGARQKRGRKGKKPTGDTRVNTDIGHIKQEQQCCCSEYLFPISFLKENQGDENDKQLLDGQKTVALMSANGQLGSCRI